MGKKAKTSRKGKKAWRANISTEDIEEYFEKATKDSHSGGNLSSVPSESLFYYDKASKDIPIKRKIEKHREKILRHDSILQKNTFIQPVPSSTLKKPDKKRKTIAGAPKDGKNLTSGLTDIWSEEENENKQPNKKLGVTLIPAVEVEPPGCSFNPPFEAHQDSLAEAVAVEMKKIYQTELGPQPVPLTVYGEVVEEDEKYFLDASEGDDEPEDAEADVDDTGSLSRTVKTKRVTRVELNRRSRRKLQMKAEQEAKKRAHLAKEIDCLPNIAKEIEREDEEKRKRHVRRVTARHERLKSAPPRLGKHKFQPSPPMQVQLSEEISGSLRKLKGCYTLARDRFKSLEKRGLVVPRAGNSRH